MAAFAITSFTNTTCSSHHLKKKQWRVHQVKSKKMIITNVMTPKVDQQGQTHHQNVVEIKDTSSLLTDDNANPTRSKEAVQDSAGTESTVLRFSDERWKNGTWDLNMFVKNGKMDWDSVIVAEAKRRKFLELFPEAATNQEPVVFRTSIIPWWAWMTHYHLPEAELLNGRAAMVGFFTSYLVDVLTGLDMVGQMGNFVCKTALLATVAGVILFRKKKDFDNLKNLADEATFYDKQWQASWQDQPSTNAHNSKQQRK